uniref:Transmembrane protein n=1 Tax=Kalanchoe fedtschenkoi TaxID=63787 RepID=A0A7N0VE82_KALFE
MSKSSFTSRSHYHTHKLFLLCNYILLGAAFSCIFLTLPLRLLLSLDNFFHILLQAFTIRPTFPDVPPPPPNPAPLPPSSLPSSRALSPSSLHRDGGFLGSQKLYVHEDEGDMRLKLAGRLCVVIFFLEWLVLAFMLKYYMYVERDVNCVTPGGSKSSAKVEHDQDLKD